VFFADLNCILKAAFKRINPAIITRLFLSKPFYLYNMKMRNDDLKKITEIKQYLLDPPVTFKLYEYALGYLKEAITVLTAYTSAKDITTDLQSLLGQLESKSIPQDELRSRLKEAGIKISKLTSQ
jgi:hypothetical protein